MIGESLLAAVETGLTLKEFVEGGGLAHTLRTIADVEADAAALCLQNISRARVPQREVILAIGHLQSASIAARKQYQGSTALAQGFHFQSLKVAASHDHVLCVLMAICYGYLGERTLMRHNIQGAWNAAKWVAAHLNGDHIAFWAGFANPVNYTFDESRSEWVLGEDFTCLCSRLDAICPA